ncbi:MAG: hypothetical protein NTY19_24865 [Planctomycetota bacterium]|nr:hypothetical protein [Planctomycetota bacterium]
MYNKALGGVVSAVVLLSVAALAVAVFAPSIFPLGTGDVPVAAETISAEPTVGQSVTVADGQNFVSTLKDWQYTAQAKPTKQPN